MISALRVEFGLTSRREYITGAGLMVYHVESSQHGSSHYHTVNYCTMGGCRRINLWRGILFLVIQKQPLVWWSNELGLCTWHPLEDVICGFVSVGALCVMEPSDY